MNEPPKNELLATGETVRFMLALEFRIGAVEANDETEVSLVTFEQLAPLPGRPAFAFEVEVAAGEAEPFTVGKTCNVTIDVELPV